MSDIFVLIPNTAIRNLSVITTSWCKQVTFSEMKINVDLIEFFFNFWYLMPLSAIMYIMATSFSGGRCQRTWREPPTMGKQLVNFITCGAQTRLSHSARRAC